MNQTGHVHRRVDRWLRTFLHVVKRCQYCPLRFLSCRKGVHSVYLSFVFVDVSFFPFFPGYVLSLVCPNSSQAWCEITNVSQPVASPILYEDLNSSISNLGISAKVENKYSVYFRKGYMSTAAFLNTPIYNILEMGLLAS